MNMEIQPLNDQQLKNDLEQIVKTHLNSYSYILQHGKKYVKYHEYIMEKTKSFVDLPYPTRIYWVLNDIHEYPKCANPNCNNELRHNLKCNPLSGYISIACSSKCGQCTEHRKLALKQTCLEKYGVEHPSQAKQFKEKFNQTILSRTQSDRDRITEKRRQTCLEKYGVDSISKLQSVSDKKSNTFKMRDDEAKAKTVLKIKQTKFERYGDENYTNAQKQSLTRQSFSDEHNQQINELRAKTVQQKYGVANVSQTDSVKQKISNRLQLANAVKFFNNCIVNNDLVEPLFDLEHYIEHSHDELMWRCKKCGKEFSSKKYHHYINSQIPARCLDCFPLRQPKSVGEDEIVEFIKTFYHGEILKNTRSVIAPLELDIWIPELKLAIEYDGVYWHSENMGTDCNYHLSKTERCENNGIQLIHIFDVEWHNNKDMVQSRLRNMIAGSNNKLFARQCKICEVGKHEANEFLSQNHMQGPCAFKHAIGLRFNDQLVSIMTFGKPRFNRDAECELLRFCNALRTQVVGGASRLLAFYEKTYHPSSIISYADRRWSIGNLYETLGFEKCGATKPNYWYWNYAQSTSFLENRVRYQKHKLKDVLDKFDKSKTEVENMFDNGYFRIFDCGNLVYKKTYG